MEWAPDSPDLWAPDSQRPDRWAPDSRRHLTLGRAVELFLAAKAAEGVSPRTTEWYRMILVRVDDAYGPAFRSDPRSRPDQSTGYWLKNVFSTRAMSSGATTCPCPSSVCRSVWGMAAVIAFAARSKKSVGRPASWGSVIGPSVVTRTD